ncbi:transcriptional regulator, partial [Micromonospora sicca]
PSRPLAPSVPTLHILAASRSVLRDGEPLPLTRLEFDLLLHLVAHPRRVFTRLQLLNAVWGYEHAGVRTVDVHVRRLRGKVGVDVPLVTTVYGVGYRLADDARVTVDRTG